MLIYENNIISYLPHLLYTKENPMQRRKYCENSNKHDKFIDNVSFCRDKLSCIYQFANIYIYYW